MINNQKCGLLELRVDARTPMSLISPLSTVPLLTKYTYLGVIIDDALNMRLDE